VTETLTATNPIANVDRQVTVASETTEPTAAEDLEDYRDKAIQATRILAQGGAQGDYVEWGLEAQGVAAIYPYKASNDSNAVDLFVEATIADSTDNKGTAGAQILAEVEEKIEEPIDANTPARKPMSVVVNYQSVTPLDIDITLIDFVDITAEKTAAIEAALTAYFAGVRPFLSGVDVPSEKNDTVTLNAISAVVLEAVPGAIFLFPQMEVDGNNVTEYTFSGGDIPYFNSLVTT
jgi:uncharacterized phage protein gp47/JayE